MAYSIRTRNVVTPRPTMGPGMRPVLTAAAFSSNTMMTVNTGQWTGPRNTFAYQWYRGSGAVWASISGATSASFLPSSTERGSSVAASVSVTNQYGTRTVGVTPITIL